jgi:hypothetical protein
LGTGFSGAVFCFAFLPGFLIALVGLLVLFFSVLSPSPCLALFRFCRYAFLSLCPHHLKCLKHAEAPLLNPRQPPTPGRERRPQQCRPTRGVARLLPTPDSPSFCSLGSAVSAALFLTRCLGQSRRRAAGVFEFFD